jgi:hypothetical protein
MDKIDELLLDWFEWSQAYSPALDYGKAEPACRDFRISRQWMDYDDLNEEVERNLKASVGKLVEPLVHRLDLRARVAVNTACRNFASGAQVWSSIRIAGDQETEYARAKAILCPMMVDAGLIERTACKPLESVL